MSGGVKGTMLKWVISARECAKSIDKKFGFRTPPSQASLTKVDNVKYGAKSAGPRREVRRTRSLPGSYEHSTTRIDKNSRFDPRTKSQGNIEDSFCVQEFDSILPHSILQLSAQKIKIFDQIEKEQRLRDGAEKLFKATDNQKLRDRIAQELCLINSNLQLLRQKQAELADAVASLDEGHPTASICFPMVSPGMKEMKNTNCFESIKPVLSSHYHENSDDFRFELDHIADMRQKCCEVSKNEEGLETLFNYYNQLYFVDRRFFPATECGPVVFTWYDAITGLPTNQSSISLERGSILFNIGVLYAQKAMKLRQNRSKGLSLACEDFQRSAGAFQYLKENFSNAPSTDMQMGTTNLLIHTMLTQGRECLVEERVSEPLDTCDTQLLIDLSQETAFLSSLFAEASSMLTGLHNIPILWPPIMECKRHYYNALAHYYLASALLRDHPDPADVDPHAELIRLLSTVYSRPNMPQLQDREQLNLIARTHLRQSIVSSEAALKTVSTHMRLQLGFHHILKKCHDRCLQTFSDLEEEDDFAELIPAFEIYGRTRIEVESTPVDFSRYKVEDIFHRLGCISVFSGRHMWTKPKTVTLHKTKDEEFGFSIRGDSPVIIASIDEGSLAAQSEMLVGDFIVAIGDVDVKWTKHDQVAGMIRSSRSTATLRLVTPVDHNYISPIQSEATSDTEPSPKSDQDSKSIPRTPTFMHKFKVKSRSPSVSSKHKLKIENFVVFENNLS